MRKILKSYFLNPKSSSGFTLAEVLISVAILALIFLAVVVNWRTQLNKGYDSRRKTDLGQIKGAFEEYYNDNDCYPPAGILNNCAGGELQPYLPAIPCDPVTKAPYYYVPNANPCSGYRVLAGLAVTADPDIPGVGCSPINGCGYGVQYNWGVSSGVPVPAEGFVPDLTPTPTSQATPTPPEGATYACDPLGRCNSYADPVGNLCPIWWPQPNCNNQCGNPDNWCER